MIILVVNYLTYFDFTTLLTSIVISIKFFFLVASFLICLMNIGTVKCYHCYMTYIYIYIHTEDASEMMTETKIRM